MIDVMGKRNYFFALSILLTLAGIIGYFINGLQLDIQFEGGTVMQIEMPDGKQDITKIENTINDAIGKKVTAQMQTSYNAGASSMNFLTLKVSKENTLNDAERKKVVEVLRSDFGVKTEANMSVRSVEPFIGAELLAKGIQAGLIASLLMIIYLWYRFRIMSGGPSAAVFAIVGMIHDLLIMCTVYIIFRIPINESFIAAVLTILGYSINDTIVIYDRIRENTGLLRKLPIEDLINRSIVQTLSRSINTGMAVIFSIVVTYAFASYYNIASLKEFVFPLLVGIISGSYSSIFISSSLWLIWKQSKQKNQKLRAKASKA